MSILLFMLLVLLMILSDVNAMKRLMIGIFLGGFFALSLFDVSAREKSARSAKTRFWTSAWFRLLLALVSPLFLLGSLHSEMELIHVVFQRLGIRMLNVSVEVPASERDPVERISEVLNRPILDCHRSGKEGRLLIHHADVLWTGIGNITYLSFEVSNPVRSGWLDPDPKPLRQATLRIDTSSIRILEARPPLNPCFDLSNDTLFGTAKYDLTPEAKARLTALASLIKADGQIKRIVVRGHSDARPVGAQMERDVGDNQRLSERRAQAVADELKTPLGIPSLDIAVEGAGSREPKVSCPIGPATTPYEAQQCNAPNRRVEIRVIYAPSLKPPEDSTHRSTL